MGEEPEFKNVFVVCDDGTLVPFEGITEVPLSDDAVDVYAHFPDTIGPITIELNMKQHDNRKALKFLIKQMNAYRRRVRYYKRQKERARRRALKESVEILVD